MKNIDKITKPTKEYIQQLMGICCKNNLSCSNEYIDEYLSNFIDVITGKIKIMCSKHGIFEKQIKGLLISKHICMKCFAEIQSKRYSITFDRDIFLEAMYNIHGYKYKYLHLDEFENNYDGYSTKIKITCDKHGIFEQTFISHLNGTNCKQCVIDKLRINEEWFFKKSKELHGDKFEYPEQIFDFSSKSNKLEIICKKHNFKFKQSIKMHTEGANGCKKCDSERKIKTYSLTYEEFENKANIIFNNEYEYFHDYTKFKNEIKVKCSLHGTFKIRACSHLNGQGCQSCRLSKEESSPENEWLNYINIPNNTESRQVKILNDKRYKVDGYIESTNTVYEFNGDYWHGNPNIFNLDDIQPTKNITYRELYEKTLKKEQKIKNAGYNLVTIWEADWKKFKKDNNLKFKNGELIKE